MNTAALAASGGVNKLNASTAAAGATAGIAKKAMIGLVGAFVGFAAAASAARTIAEFSDSMATLEAVSVTANVALERQAAVFGELRQKALDLGATTRYTASEAGEGLLFLARAGFTAEEQLASIDATLALASAGMLSLGEAADFASNIVMQFSLAASETERVADALVNVSNRANTNVRQMAEAMKFAGPVAGALGISLETAAASVGVLGDRGIQASMAGTNLRGTMLALAAPTSKAKAAFDTLKISLEDVDPARRSWIEIWETFAGAFDDLAVSADRAGLANAIFGRRNVAGALILSDSTDRMRELVQIQEEQRGATLAQAEAMEDTLGGAFRRLRSATEAYTLSIGDAGLGGGLRSVVETMAQMFRVMSGMDGAVDDANAAAVALASTIHSLVAALVIVAGLKVSAMIVAWGVQLTATNVVFATTAPLIGNITVATTGWAVAWRGLNAVMVAHPILAAVAAIAALTTAVTLMGRRTEEQIARQKRLREEFNRLQSEESARRRNIAITNRATEVGDTEALVDSSMGKLRKLVELSLELRQGAAENLSSYEARLARILAGDLPGLQTTTGSDRAQAFLQARQQQQRTQAQIDLDNLVAARMQSDPTLGTPERAEAIQVIEDRIAELRLELEAYASASDQAANSTIAVSDAFSNARIALESYLSGLELEAKLAGMSKEEQELTIATREAGRKSLEAYGFDVIKFATAMARAADAVRERQKAEKDLADSNAAIERDKQATESLNAYIETLRAENELLSMDAKDRELAAAERHAQALAGEQEIKTELALIRELIRERQRLREEQKAPTPDTPERMSFDEKRAERAQTRLHRLNEELATQFALISKTTEEKERARAVDEYRLQAQLAGIENVEAETEAYSRLYEELQRLQLVEETARTISADAASSIADVVFQVEDLSEAWENFARATARTFFDQAFTKPLTDQLTDVLVKDAEKPEAQVDPTALLLEKAGTSLNTAALTLAGAMSAGAAELTAAALALKAAAASSSFAPPTPGVPAVESAQGNVFMNGAPLTFFGQGGLIDEMGIFPLKNGGIGIAGEAGPEAAMKVARMPNGDLGVQASESSGSRGITVQGPLLVVQAKDADSFRRSRVQIQDDLRRVTTWLS